MPEVLKIKLINNNVEVYKKNSLEELTYFKGNQVEICFGCFDKDEDRAGQEIAEHKRKIIETIKIFSELLSKSKNLKIDTIELGEFFPEQYSELPELIVNLLKQNQNIKKLILNSKTFSIVSAVNSKTWSYSVKSDIFLDVLSFNAFALSDFRWVQSLIALMHSVHPKLLDLSNIIFIKDDCRKIFLEAINEICSIQAIQLDGSFLASHNKEEAKKFLEELASYHDRFRIHFNKSDQQDNSNSIMLEKFFALKCLEDQLLKLRTERELKAFADSLIDSYKENSPQIILQLFKNQFQTNPSYFSMVKTIFNFFTFQDDPVSEITKSFNRFYQHKNPNYLLWEINEFVTDILDKPNNKYTEQKLSSLENFHLIFEHIIEKLQINPDQLKSMYSSFI